MEMTDLRAIEPISKFKSARSVQLLWILQGPGSTSNATTSEGVPHE